MVTKKPPPSGKHLLGKIHLAAFDGTRLSKQTMGRWVGGLAPCFQTLRKIIQKQLKAANRKARSKSKPKPQPDKACRKKDKGKSSRKQQWNTRNERKNRKKHKQFKMKGLHRAKKPAHLL